MRLPLIGLLESRDSTLSKDSILVNGYIEQMDQQTIFIIKRPGLINKIAGTGLGQGVFAYGNYVYSWDSGKTATTPSATLISGL